MKYISSTNTIIISPKFNEKLSNEYIKIISKFDKVIFSNYKLNDKLFEAYKNNKFNSFKYIGNEFNSPVDNLSSSLTHLTFGQYFTPLHN